MLLRSSFEFRSVPGIYCGFFFYGISGLYIYGGFSNGANVVHACAILWSQYGHATYSMARALKDDDGIAHEVHTDPLGAN